MKIIDFERKGNLVRFYWVMMTWRNGGAMTGMIRRMSTTQNESMTNTSKATAI